MIEWNSQHAIWHPCTSRPVEKTLTMHLPNWIYLHHRSSVIWIDTANLLAAVSPRLEPAICYFWKPGLVGGSVSHQCQMLTRAEFSQLFQAREHSDNGHGTELCNRSVLWFWPGSCDVTNRQNRLTQKSLSTFQVRGWIWAKTVVFKAGRGRENWRGDEGKMQMNR